MIVDALPRQVVRGAEHHWVVEIPQQGWPRPPQAPHDPAAQAAVPPSGTVPVGQEAPTTMQIGAAVPVCTQQPPFEQRLPGQQGCAAPPHRPHSAELVTQTVSGSEQFRSVDGGRAGQQVRPADPQPSQLPALHAP